MPEGQERPRRGPITTRLEAGRSGGEMGGLQTVGVVGQGSNVPRSPFLLYV